MRQGKPSKNNKASYFKLVFGFLLISIGVLTLLNKNKASLVISSSFENEPVRVEGLKLSGESRGETPEKIIIPSLSIDLPVKESKVVNGYWEVFPDSAGWGEGSGRPGQPGNQVIFAHAKRGLFLPLRSIEIGEIIYVFTKDKYYSYAVSEVEEVKPGQTEVIAETPDEILTLYTCSGFADSKRLIVIAKRVS